MKPTPMPPPRFVEEWPDHMGLPDEDGVRAQSTLEHPQSNILYESFKARLKELHPDGNYFVSCNMGIYFDYTDPVLDGCRAPDWYYVPGSPAMYQGHVSTFARPMERVASPLSPHRVRRRRRQRGARQNAGQGQVLNLRERHRGGLLCHLRHLEANARCLL